MSALTNLKVRYGSAVGYSSILTCPQKVPFRFSLIISPIVRLQISFDHLYLQYFSNSIQQSRIKSQECDYF